MKRLGLIILCVLPVVALCACGKRPDTPVSSAPVSDAQPNGNDQSSTSTTTGALVVTDTQGTAVTNLDGSPVTTYVTALPTTVRPVTDPNGSTVTDENGTNKTEIVVPPHITVSTAVTTTTTTASATTTTTNTTKPTHQEVAGSISLPAEGYTPDNRIKLGAVSLQGQTVTMVIRNISAVWQPEDGKSYFEYTCYDKNNGKLSVGKIDFGFIPVKSSKICTFEIPKNTVKVLLTDFQVEYWSVPV